MRSSLASGAALASLTLGDIDFTFAKLAVTIK